MAATTQTSSETELIDTPAKSPGRSPLVAILGATFGTGNHGVSALASGTLSAIRRGLPGAKIVVIDYDNEPVTWHDNIGHESVPVELINLRFSKRIFLPNNVARLIAIACLIRLVPIKSWRRALVKKSSWLSRLAAPDLNLSLNGGDSFSDIYGLARLAYVVLPQLLLLLLERPLIQLPQTHGPFKTATARAVARYILKHSSIVYSRDHEGVAVVKELLGPRGQAARFAYDMGFALEPTPPTSTYVEQLSNLKAKGPLIGFNVSGLLAIGGYSGKNMFGLKSDYWQLIDTVLTRLLADPANQILLVPHVFGPETNAESDVNACRQIMAKFGDQYSGRLHYFPGYFDHHETKYIIGQCDFFLGSRMHACIGALSQCIPAVGLAYSRKFAGVMELVGEGACVIDLRTLDIAEIATALDQAWGRHKKMRADLLEKMPGLRRSVLELCVQPEIHSLLSK
jgi:polysaccharide pyruvyl transferase WcaK-like protein